MDCEIHKTLIDGKRFLKFDDAMPYIRYTACVSYFYRISMFNIQKENIEMTHILKCNHSYDIQGKNVGGNESKFEKGKWSEKSSVKRVFLPFLL